MTFAEEIESAVGGAKNIQAIALARSRKEYYWEVDRLMSWEEARDELNYNYDAGYGGQDCHNVYIWTADRVYFIHEYDGSTHLTYVPRHPECL
jgi:hypothetical protein